MVAEDCVRPNSSSSHFSIGVTSAASDVSGITTDQQFQAGLSDKYKWSARLVVVNLTNKVAWYNFLSSFSRTHYISPRTATAATGFHS